MINRENKDALLPHDGKTMGDYSPTNLSPLIGYLKLFQLNKLKIPGYDCLLIDEAQDITPGIIHYYTDLPIIL